MAKTINIPVKIPFDLKKENLGAAYNASMASVEDWVLLLDHDVFLANPNWYKLCVDAVNTLGHDAGWISCRTDRVSSPAQALVGENAVRSHDMEHHLKVAKEREQNFKGKYTDVTSLEPPLSGFFILTHKKAWQDVKGFHPGFLGVDNNYHIRLRNAGYKVYVAEDLYCYHRYMRYWKDD